MFISKFVLRKMLILTVNLHRDFLSACFFNTNFLKKIFQEHYIRVSNSLNAVQDGRSVCSDLGPNCLQRLSVDNKSRH